MKVVAIVQARMGSTRLPGKVMMELAGEPMLVRVLNRVRRARSLDETIVATTMLRDDDVIEALCRGRGWRCFRGSENDVLDRYYHAAAHVAADAVVRITSDCPLIDPEIVDRVVGAFVDPEAAAEYASNVFPIRTFPRGLDTEVIGFDTLARIWKQDYDPASREHVTPYVHRHAEAFRIVAVQNEENHSEHRWTVDTAEDFSLVSLVYDHYGHDLFSWNEIISFLEWHPEWSELNRHVRQKNV